MTIDRLARAISEAADELAEAWEEEGLKDEDGDEIRKKKFNADVADEMAPKISLWLMGVRKARKKAERAVAILAKAGWAAEKKAARRKGRKI